MDKTRMNTLSFSEYSSKLLSKLRSLVSLKKSGKDFKPCLRAWQYQAAQDIVSQKSFVRENRSYRYLETI